MTDNDSQTQDTASHRKRSRLRRWVTVLILANALIIGIVYELHNGLLDPKTTNWVVASMAALTRIANIVAVLRIGLELLVYYFWRPCIAILRRWFRLRHRTTWLLLQCRPLLRLFLILDIGAMLLLNLP